MRSCCGYLQEQGNSESSIPISYKSTHLPRDDFKELLKLNLLYLNRQGASEFAFRRPEAQHRARWMSAPVYSFRIYLLHNRLELDATLLRRSKRFCDFVSICYAFYCF